MEDYVDDIVVNAKKVYNHVNDLTQGLYKMQAIYTENESFEMCF